MKGIAGLIIGFSFLAFIGYVMISTFFILYSVVVWLDLPELPHALLGICVVVASTLVGGGAGAWVDRRFLNPP